VIEGEEGEGKSKLKIGQGKRIAKICARLKKDIQCARENKS